MRRLSVPPLLLALAFAGPAGAQRADEPAAATPADNAPPPMQVEGLWCGSGPLREFSLKLTQNQQDVEGELARHGRVRTIEGRIEGNVLRTQATRVGALVLEKQGENLKVTAGDGSLALARGTSFHRSPGGSCG